MQLCLAVRVFACVCVNILLIIIEINNFLNVHTAQRSQRHSHRWQRSENKKQN